MLFVCFECRRGVQNIRNCPSSLTGHMLLFLELRERCVCLKFNATIQRWCTSLSEDMSQTRLSNCSAHVRRCRLGPASVCRQVGADNLVPASALRKSAAVGRKRKAAASGVALPAARSSARVDIRLSTGAPAPSTTRELVQQFREGRLGRHGRWGRASSRNFRALSPISFPPPVFPFPSVIPKSIQHL